MALLDNLPDIGYIDNLLPAAIIGWLLGDFTRSQAESRLEKIGFTLSQNDLDWLQEFQTNYNALSTAEKGFYIIRIQIYLPLVMDRLLTPTQFRNLLSVS